MDIKLEVIAPGQVFDVAAIQRELIAAATEAIDEAEKQYGIVTATFSHDPEFEREKGMDGDDYYDQVGSDRDVVEYLDDGTLIRYATMEFGFEAETFENELRSGPGKGGVVYVNTKYP